MRLLDAVGKNDGGRGSDIVPSRGVTRDGKFKGIEGDELRVGTKRRVDAVRGCTLRVEQQQLISERSC